MAGCPHVESCKKSLDLALPFCQELGFPVKQEKVVGPAMIIEFQGILIDIEQMQLCLPLQKLYRLRRLIQSWKERKSCTKYQLLSLIGYLQHASTVVKPGRTFLRRMIDTSKRQIHLDAPMRLNTGFRSDIIWWSLFLERWNGVSIIWSLHKIPVDS